MAAPLPIRPSAVTTAPGIDDGGSTDAWQELAACKGMDAALFYPQVSDTDMGIGTESQRKYREGQEVCCSCPVQVQCLQYALDRDEKWGLWGGLTPRDRRRVKEGQPTVRKICPRGHFLAEVGTDNRNRCCQCQRDAAKWFHQRRTGGQRIVEAPAHRSSIP